MMSGRMGWFFPGPIPLRPGVAARAAGAGEPGELLDQAYLDTWAEALGVTALLAEVRSRVGGAGPAA
jgi:hypothetical protein